MAKFSIHRWGRRSFKAIFLGCLSLGSMLALTPAFAPNSQTAHGADAAEKYDMRYKFTDGERVRWKVTHLASTETRIQGTQQTSKSKSISTKVWTVTAANDEQITLENYVDDVDMWQGVAGRTEIAYNSRVDKTAPPAYEAVAKSVGVPLARVTIDIYGRELKRETLQPSFAMGGASLAIPLPGKPIAVGETWHASGEATITLPGEPEKRVKTRQVYTLEKVQTGVAYIHAETEVLTPVTDPREQAQIMQQLTKGTIQFDIDAGRLRHKQLDWDGSVVGFNTPDSLMKYLARFLEEELPAEPTGEVAASPAARKADDVAGGGPQEPAVLTADQRNETGPELGPSQK